MKKMVIFFAGILILWGFISLYSGDKTEASTDPQKENSIPASLDALYPPRAPAPIFLLKMIEMASSLTAIGVNYFESDFDNMQGSFQRFKNVYTELPKLVPEWKEYFSEKNITELEAALNSKDMGKIGPAFEKMGGVCQSCHAVNQTIVQHKYQWDDFSNVTVTDPVGGKDNSFAEFMHQVAFSYDGITTDLMENQLENSRKHFADFKKRFIAMSESCYACHNSERRYYVDEGVMSMINNIGEEIGKEAPDVKKIQGLAEGIGFESCYKCHLVHQPAAYSQYKLRKSAATE